MARDYSEYFEPDAQIEDEGGIGNVIGPFAALAGTAVAFNTPLIPRMAKDLFKTAGRTAGWTTRKMWSTAAEAPGLLNKAYQSRAVIGSKALSYGKSFLGRASGVGRGGMRAAEFITKPAHFAPLMTGVVAGRILWDAARGMMEPIGGGPENRTVYDTSAGLPPDNLGATGDLTLALHQRRRR